MAHTLHLEKTASLRDNNSDKSQLEPFYQYATELHVYRESSCEESHFRQYIITQYPGL